MIRIRRLIVWIIPIFKVFENNRKEWQARLREHAHTIYETGNTSRGEGASGETKEEYFISIDVILAHVIIGFPDISGDSFGSRPADDSIYGTS
jgi:hypothetical protein